MDAKKGVLAVVVLFIGFYLFTDPAGLAELASAGGGKGWEITTQLFEATIRFLDELIQVVMGLVSTLTDPNIRKHLLRDEGEVIVDEVKHHWVVHLLSMVEVVVALALLVVFPFVDLDLAWFPFLLAFVILAHAGWRSLKHHMDRFVVTNMRVFRVEGVLAQQLATMPLTRILDITVKKPLHGRLLGFGHFVFESAAQEQGLRDIRYVGRPDDRDLAIQRVVQRSGLRGPKVN